MENLSPDERQNSRVLSWKIKPAPSQCDIVWENLQDKTIIDYFYLGMINLLMFVFCILLLSPFPIIAFLNEFINGIKGNTQNEVNQLLTSLQLYIQPLIIVIFNSGIIPTICDVIAYLENHKTKSSKQVHIMRKNFFFQIMNTIFLQITVATTIKALLERLDSTNFDFEGIRRLLLTNFVNFLFLSLSIQVTFISNGIQLLDIPHHLVKLIKYVMHKQAQKKEENPTQFIDDYPFDLGYFQSNAIVIFCMGLIFSASIPLISGFLSLFFYFRYYIDKYNLIFVYKREFEGGGIIVKKQVLPLMILSLYLFQVLNLFYFSLLDTYYFKYGLLFLSIQSLGLLFFKVYYNNKKRADKIKLAQLEQDMTDAEAANQLGINNDDFGLRQNQENRQSGGIGQVVNIDQEVLLVPHDVELDEKGRSQRRRRSSTHGLMNWIDRNVLRLLSDRRLTTDLKGKSVGSSMVPLNQDNIKRLKNAYRHPYLKIPPEYFEYQPPTNDILNPIPSHPMNLFKNQEIKMTISERETGVFSKV